MASMIGGIVTITLAAIMLASVYMPTAVHGANQTYDCINSSGGAAVCNWSGTETSLWSVLGLAGIIGLVLGVLSVFGVL